MYVTRLFSGVLQAFVSSCDACCNSFAVPEDFDFNPQSGRHGDRTHRMELKRASVEYVAPSEYMVGSTKVYMRG